MIIDRATFGPGGNSESFYEEGHKGTVEAPAWVKAKGEGTYKSHRNLSGRIRRMLIASCKTLKEQITGG